MTKRTTINLPDDLWKAAKIQALEHGKDFQELIADRLRQGLGITESLRRAIEKIAQPAIVSQKTLKKALEPSREMAASLERALKPLIDDAKERSRAVEQTLRVVRAQLEKDTIEQLQRGAQAWADVNTIIEAALKPTKRGKR